MFREINSDFQNYIQNGYDTVGVIDCESDILSIDTPQLILDTLKSKLNISSFSFNDHSIHFDYNEKTIQCLFLSRKNKSFYITVKIIEPID